MRIATGNENGTVLVLNITAVTSEFLWLCLVESHSGLERSCQAVYYSARSLCPSPYGGSLLPLLCHHPASHLSGAGLSGQIPSQLSRLADLSAL